MLENLDTQIASARKRVHREGYDMSFGELANMYQRSELVINPEYQRLFRWTKEKRTAFVESLLLNIPIPPIFVFTDENGVWELIDGLQRVSTVLELMGILKSPDGDPLPRLTCGQSDLLPALEGRFWPEENEEGKPNTLSQSQMLSIRRAKVRIEILDQLTDPEVKFELFQRLNTGGTNLSEQEVRDCIVTSLSSDVQKTIVSMADEKDFRDVCDVGQEKKNRQYLSELVTRFIVLRNFPYKSGIDVHKYLDKGIISIIENKEFDWIKERATFSEVMSIINNIFGSNSFKTNKRFSLGKFEFIILGLSKRIESGPKISDEDVKKLVNKINDFEPYKRYSGAGIRGTQRLSKLISDHAENFFKNK